MGDERVDQDIAQFIDRNKWPDYLLAELRITRHKLTRVADDVTQIKEDLGSLTLKFDEAQKYSWDVAHVDHAQYHKSNEHKWGMWTFIGRYRWQSLLAMLLLGMFLTGVLRVPVTKVISAYKSIKTLELQVEKPSEIQKKELEIMLQKYTKAYLDSVTNKH